MESRKIKNFNDFRIWMKIRMIEQGISQNELAEQMKIARPRISEATYGKRSGRKYIIPIIKQLNGNMEDFEEFLKAI